MTRRCKPRAIIRAQSGGGAGDRLMVGILQKYSGKSIQAKVFRQKYSGKSIQAKVFRQKYSGKSIQAKVFRQKYSGKRARERARGSRDKESREIFVKRSRLFCGGGWRGCGGDRHYLLRHGIPGVMREDVAIAPLPGSISFRLSKPSSHPLPPSGWQG